MRIWLAVLALFFANQPVALGIGRGPYLIQDANSSQCWHIRAASNELRADVITWTCRKESHFLFEFIPVTSEFFKDDDLYYIKDVNSGNCLHIKAASLENRAPVWTWNCSEVKGRPHAMFRLLVADPSKPNLYYIQDRNSGKCLHVKAASHELRSPLWTWTCTEQKDKPHALFYLRRANSNFP